MRVTGEETYKPRSINWPARFLTIAVIAVLSLAGSSASFAGGGPNVTGAKLYIQQNALDKAIDVLIKEVSTINEKNEDAWYLLGYVYSRQEKYDKMLDAFNKALALKPKFQKKGVKIGKDTGTLYHSSLGVEQILKAVWAKSFNSGVKHFNAAVNAEDDSVKGTSFEQAIGCFSDAAMIQPDSTLSYRNWAAALINAGRSDESIVPLTTALEKNPKDVDVIMMLSNVYMNSGRDSLAIPILEQLWSYGVQTEEVADNLSRVYIRSNQIEKAKGVFKAAIETNPSSYHFRFNYGTILLESKSFDEAIEHLAKAHEIDPSSPDISYNLGAAYLNRGVNTREGLAEDSEDKSYLEDFKSAFPFLEQSIKINPDDESSWFALGRIAGQLNKIVLAGYAFSKGEPTKSALDDKIIVGMPTETLKAIMGEPDAIKAVESEVFSTVEEWGYKERRGSKGIVGIPEPLRVYVHDGRVDALMVLK